LGKRRKNGRFLEKHQSFMFLFWKNTNVDIFNPFRVVEDFAGLVLLILNPVGVFQGCTYLEY
jgi:hypothetical protein